MHSAAAVVADDRSVQREDMAITLIKFFEWSNMCNEDIWSVNFRSAVLDIVNQSPANIFQ